MVRFVLFIAFFNFFSSGNLRSQPVLGEMGRIPNVQLSELGLRQGVSGNYMLVYQKPSDQTWFFSMYQSGHRLLQTAQYASGLRGAEVMLSDEDHDGGFLIYQKGFRLPAIYWNDPLYADSFSIIRPNIKDRIEAEHFWIIGNYAIIGANHKSQGYVLYRIGLINGETERIVLGRKDRLPVKLEQLSEIPGQSGFMMLLKFESKRQSVFWLQACDDQMNPTGPLLRVNKKEPLKSGRVVHTEQGWLLTGTLSNSSKASINGFYSVWVSEDLTKKELKRFSLQRLNHFFNYLDPSQRQMVLRQSNSLDRYNRSYELETHHLSIGTVEDAGLVYAGFEFFRPTFIVRTMMGPHGWSTYQQFDGYAYTHASILVFDAKGNLVKDHCLPLRMGQKSWNPERKLIWFLNEAGVQACYFDQDVLKYSILRNEDFAIFKSTTVIRAADIPGLRLSTVGISNKNNNKRMLGLLFSSIANNQWNNTPRGGSLFFIPLYER